MQFLVVIHFLFLLTSPTAAQDSVCEPGYLQCAPVGASRRGVPVIGPDLARFYLELVYTVQGIPDSHYSNHRTGQDLGPRQEVEGDSLCCAEAAVCNIIRSFRIAFCWDHFTACYFLPDGSYGSAANGSYTTPAGDTANLITGEYQMKDGTQGNIYNESPADRPDTTDLPIPTPWTSSGVGAAIPASELGAQDTTVTPWSTATTATATSSPALLTSSTDSFSSTSLSSALPSSTPASSVPENTSTPLNSTAPVTPAIETSSTATVATTGSESAQDSIAPTSDGSAMSGTAGASGTSSNGSYPIVPPITNLAAATVVYCMAVKVLAWAVTAVMMA